MPYKIDGPLYAFCGTFSGKESAAGWLRKLDHELSGCKQDDSSILPDKYLDAINMLLTDKARDWANSHPEAVCLLNTEEPTKTTVETCRALLCEQVWKDRKVGFEALMAKANGNIMLHT